MKERPVAFGPNGSLVGVITEPPVINRSHKIACIFVNAGLVHRVGPNRIYVRLSRQVASFGYTALRFDLANRGDSDGRRDGLPFHEGCVVDLRAAMDQLQRAVGAEKFVLMGICSGAINALHAATVDPRVIGAIAIDGPAYQTVGHYVRRYSQRLFRTRTWINVLTGRGIIRRLLKVQRLAGKAKGQDEFAHLYAHSAVPSRGDSERLLREIIDRGAKLLFIYTGSWSIYNYENQFRDAFPELMKSGAIRVVYAPDADHTFSRLHHQERLLGIVGGWFGDVLGGAAGEPDASREEAAAAR